MKLFFTVICLLLSYGVFANNIENSISAIFTANDLNRIYSGEIVSRMFVKYNATNENTDEFIAVPETPFTGGNYSEYEVVCDEKAFFPIDISQIPPLRMFNLITSYSNLKGAEYWSFNGGRKVVFIEDCYSMQSSRNRQRMADIRQTSLAPQSVFYFMQKDNKFGNMAFKSEIFNAGNSFVMINSTLDPIFPINSAGEYKTITFLIYNEQKRGYLFYTIFLMRIRNALLLKSGRIYATTFSNRLRGATVHLAGLLGLNWDNKLVTWDQQKLMQGFYRNY